MLQELNQMATEMINNDKLVARRQTLPGNVFSDSKSSSAIGAWLKTAIHRRGSSHRR